MLKVGVIGATGYTGEEIIKLLAGHPKVEITHLSAIVEKEEPFSNLFPKLKGRVDIVCKKLPQIFNNEQDRPYNSLLDVQVLSPMKNSIIGVNALNSALQAGLNPAGVQSENKIRKGEHFFCEGAKVIQLQNNYDKFVMNGDIGLIHHIDKKEGVVEVLFYVTLDGENIAPVSYKAHELDQLTLAYATTIHKSQGSEYPIVVMPISTQHYIMLQRNLLYTGVTRGKKLVVLIGQREALEIAVKNNKTNRRLTSLKEKLVNAKSR